MLDQIESKTLRLVVIGAGILILGTFAWAGTFILLRGNISEITEIALPIVIIAGLVVLLLVLGLLAFVFSVLKLSNPNEALGLPSGTVRAVIALMLLVIFAIVAIFLYSDVASSGRMRLIEGVKAEDVAGLRKQLDVVAVVETKDNKATVHYREQTSRTAEDLAKQLIVLLGTLVTAVSSFYFGSSSVAAANKPQGGAGGPNAKGVTPPTLKADGTPKTLTVGGTNLENVKTAKLKLGDQTIPATAVTATATQASCTFQADAGKAAGPWDLVLSDSSNNDSTLPKSVTIT